MNKNIRQQINKILKTDVSSENKISSISAIIFKFKTGLDAPCLNLDYFNEIKHDVSIFYYHEYLTIKYKDFFKSLEMQFKL